MSKIRADNVTDRLGTGAPDFPLGLTGVAATFTSDVSIGGTLTYEDVTSIDSVGVVTARKGLRVTAEGIKVTAGISTFGSGIHAQEGINVTAGVGTFAGAVTAGSVVVGSAVTIDSNGIDIDAGITTSPEFQGNIYRIGTGATIHQDGSNNLRFGTNSVGFCTITSNRGLWLNNGELVENGSVTASALNGEFDFKFEDGMCQTYTTNSTGTFTPDFKVSASISLNQVMQVGDLVTATLWSAQNNTAYFCNSVKIDNSTSNIDLNWVGGSTPTAGYDVGYDVYTFTIQKTAVTPAYIVTANLVSTHNA